MHYRVKAYGEWAVIRAMDARRGQRTLTAQTVLRLYWSDAA